MKQFDLEAEKTELLKNVRFLKSLNVVDFTFHKKCDELQDKFVTVRSAVHDAKACLWKPNDFNDESSTIAHIENLKPKVVICDDDQLKKLWEIYRLYVSTGIFNQTPGRFIKFLVVDTNQEESRPLQHITRGVRLGYDFPWLVLGLGVVSSDFTAIKCRDDYIGWTPSQRNGSKGKHDGKLRHTANGATIVATQPFGFNFLGGKLISALITSEIIRNEWQLRFGDVLAGMTTTSLYGFPSMYDGLKWWKRLDLTKGKVPIQPDAYIYKKWLQYVKKSKAKEFAEMMKQDEDTSGPVTNYKGKVLDMIYEVAGIPIDEFQTGYERGVYFSSFYENTKEFLCGKIGEDELKLKPLFQGDVNTIMEWWRPEAIERYKKLKAAGRLKPELQFYNHLGQMDLETAKETFLGEVGR